MEALQPAENWSVFGVLGVLVEMRMERLCQGRGWRINISTEQNMRSSFGLSSISPTLGGMSPSSERLSKSSVKWLVSLAALDYQPASMRRRAKTRTTFFSDPSPSSASNPSRSQPHTFETILDHARTRVLGVRGSNISLR